jgi:hypothetical protein
MFAATLYPNTQVQATQSQEERVSEPGGSGAEHVVTSWWKRVAEGKPPEPLNVTDVENPEQQQSGLASLRPGIGGAGGVDLAPAPAPASVTTTQSSLAAGVHEQSRVVGDHSAVAPPLPAADMPAARLEQLGVTDIQHKKVQYALDRMFAATGPVPCFCV